MGLNPVFNCSQFYPPNLKERLSLEYLEQILCNDFCDGLAQDFHSLRFISKATLSILQWCMVWQEIMYPIKAVCNVYRILDVISDQALDVLS